MCRWNSIQSTLSRRWDMLFDPRYKHFSEFLGLREHQRLWPMCYAITYPRPNTSHSLFITGALWCLLLYRHLYRISIPWDDLLLLVVSGVSVERHYVRISRATAADLHCLADCRGQAPQTRLFHSLLAQLKRQAICLPPELCHGTVSAPWTTVKIFNRRVRQHCISTYQITTAMRLRWFLQRTKKLRSCFCQPSSGCISHTTTDVPVATRLKLGSILSLDGRHSGRKSWSSFSWKGRIQNLLRIITWCSD